METEQTKTEYMDVGVGKEMLPLQPVKVKVVRTEEREVIGSDGKSIGNKLVLVVNHPSMPELEISKVKYETNKKLTTSGLWIRRDNEGKIPFKSALACLLLYYKAGAIRSLIGKEIETTTDEGGYIIAKAY